MRGIRFRAAHGPPPPRARMAPALLGFFVALLSRSMAVAGGPRGDAPLGVIGDTPIRRSHLWEPARKYRNLEWHPEGVHRRIPSERQPPPPQHLEPRKPDGSDFVRVVVQGKTIRKNRPFAMEICCGHAGLTAALWDAGFEAAGVDWVGNRHQTAVPVVNADLTTHEGRQFVWQLLESDSLVYVHMGPPCGTFTRAREKKIPQWQLDRGAPCPRPLRTTEQPEGIPSRQLTRQERIKVYKGNQIAWFCADVARYCIQKGIWFSIENPSRSILWELPQY